MKTKLKARSAFLVVFLYLVLSILAAVLAACDGRAPDPEPMAQLATASSEVPTVDGSEHEEEATMADLTALVEHPWLWISFTNPAEEFEVESPESYLLTFNSDGAVSVKADCNNASGSYTADATSLTIQLGPMTVAACPEGSRGDRFVALLGGAAKYFFEDGQLFIDLMADGGMMTFARAGGISVQGNEDARQVSTGAVLAGILGNLTYSGVLPDQQITLTSGTAYYEDGSTGRPFVRLIDHLIATGDLNGDGTEDAVAFLVDYTTGSGDFVYLAAVLNARTEPTPVEAILIGDRIPVKSLTIEDAQVIAELIAAGPSDVACCPSQQVRQVFDLEDGRLVETGREELGIVSLADLNGTSWQLVDLNLDQDPILPETEITLRIEDGQISGSAGCNTYNTNLVTGEEDLPQTFIAGPIVTTRMACEEPVMNQETTYLDRLGNAVAWRYAFGFLSLTYKLEDNVFGGLLFAPQEP